MRKKSTKSLTFSTWRGMQITKDRVSDVANPQTSAQMAQRIKMPLVAQARTKLKGLVNHSFQGVDYGYKSLYNFSALNLRKNALTVGEYAPKGTNEMGAADFVISTGSLTPINFGVTSEQYIDPQEQAWRASDGRENGDLHNCLTPAFGGLGNSSYVQTVEGAAPTDAELYNFFLNILLENVETDQISFLVQQGGSPISLDAGDGEEYAYRSNIWLYRIVAGTTNFREQEIGFALRHSESWTTAGTKHLYLNFGEDLAIQTAVTYTPATTGDNSTPGSIKLDVGADGSFPYIINNNTTNIWGATAINASSDITGGDKQVNTSNGTTTTTAPFILGPVEDIDLPFKAVAIINSRYVNNVWQRSSQRMVVLEYNPYFDATNVGKTYLKTSTASAKFLNNGGESTGIAGNSGMEVTTSSFDDSSDDEKSQG